MMRLYHDLRAPNPRRVRMFLAEKGLTDQVELVEVSIATHANMTPAFLDKNPLGLVPVLELPDGRTLRESMAICRYLEELHPQPSLFGADAWSRAQIEQWNRHAELEVLLPIAQVFRNSHVADITLLCGIDFGKVSGIRVGDDTPNLKRWHQAISARPSAKA